MLAKTIIIFVFLWYNLLNVTCLTGSIHLKYAVEIEYLFKIVILVCIVLQFMTLTNTFVNDCTTIDNCNMYMHSEKSRSLVENFDIVLLL